MVPENALARSDLLRAWQRRHEAASPNALGSWLYTIATNACLDHLRKARRRRALPQLVAPPAGPTFRMGPPTDERLWVEPLPDALFEVADDVGLRPDERAVQRESIGLACITALQFLSPKQRAALLLVDVLGWKPEEAAALLQTTPVSVNSLLQRARNFVPRRSRFADHALRLDQALPAVRIAAAPLRQHSALALVPSLVPADVWVAAALGGWCETPARLNFCGCPAAGLLQKLS